MIRSGTLFVWALWEMHSGITSVLLFHWAVWQLSSNMLQYAHSNFIINKKETFKKPRCVQNGGPKKTSRLLQRGAFMSLGSKQCRLVEVGGGRWGRSVQVSGGGRWRKSVVDVGGGRRRRSVEVDGGSLFRSVADVGGGRWLSLVEVDSRGRWRSVAEVGGSRRGWRSICD